MGGTVFYRGCIPNWLPYLETTTGPGGEDTVISVEAGNRLGDTCSTRTVGMDMDHSTCTFHTSRTNPLPWTLDEIRQWSGSKP